ncbi:MAG: GNAT family N-acetyltransferase [Acidimicrobiales bacterium]|uniref:GNAT family N-acetyltransferase n=1 Tax=Candidatus Aeolococcus gillhamiae TaxID=3127015 RepID=A0A2W6AX75_9BACT|nr:MAG: GNAT family N-acetyltransferase [Candidatus Dormibacter sp. RRmetagenome_bin12]
MRALGDQPLLRDAPKDEIRRLGERMEHFDAPAGAVLIKEGDPGSRFLLVERGRVAIRHAHHPRDVAVLGPGSLVGELSVLRRAPRTATAVALDEVRGFSGDRDALLALFAAAPDAAIEVARLAAGRLAAFASPVAVTLDSGLRLHVRPILPDDRARAAEAMAALSERSRYMRFFTPGGIPEPLLDQLVGVDYSHHFAWVALASDEPGESYLGSCRYIRSEDEPDLAEVAFGVADRHQGEGIGKLLMGALIVVARVQGIRRFKADVLSDNRPMIAILERAGASKWQLGPVTSTTFDVPPVGTLLPPGSVAEQLRAAAELVASAAPAVAL